MKECDWASSDFDQTRYKNLFDLTGKVVLISGGAGIIGSQMSKACSDLGASVAIVDVNEEAANILANNLNSFRPGCAMPVICDIQSKIQVAEMVDKLVQEFGKIDVLLNNAAGKSESLTSFFEPVENYDLDTWKTVIDINLTGMFLVAQAVGRSMVNLNVKGSIVQTSSIYGIRGPDQRIYDGSLYEGHEISSPAVYSASKAGVVGLSQYLATYWGARGIRVNTLTPGGVFSGQNQVFEEKYSNRVPLGRMAQATEIASAAVFLASDASSYITGHNLVVDGGLSCW
jgi:NAD(P)-dependent dehydrogenase (short-subunit alcohol dehydrogenase family)